jgi:hypothetical protein
MTISSYEAGVRQCARQAGYDVHKFQSALKIVHVQQPDGSFITYRRRRSYELVDTATGRVVLGAGDDIDACLNAH